MIVENKRKNISNNRKKRNYIINKRQIRMKNNKCLLNWLIISNKLCKIEISKQYKNLFSNSYDGFIRCRQTIYF